jgi:hypothetical protein
MQPAPVTIQPFQSAANVERIADYCLSDVVNTYRIWRRYELFRGHLSDADFQASEINLSNFIRAREERSSDQSSQLGRS